MAIRKQYRYNFLFNFSGCCEPGKRTWQCKKCKTLIWFDIHHQTFVCLKCEKKVGFELGFKCNSQHHGLEYIAYKEVELLRQQTNALKPIKNYNFLILGETGVGKSTWINAIANYMNFSSLKDAIDNKPVIVLPAEFTYVDNHGQKLKIKVGNGSEDGEYANSKGHAVTQGATSYKFWYEAGDCFINLIDTPGIGDPRGDEEDKKNFDKILSHIMPLDELHGIGILLKPNNARLGVMFKYCIKELLTHLHKVISMCEM